MKSYIVVGAGILGASTAYHLAKAGAKVTLVDRREPGQATSAAAGMICPWLSQRRNKSWYALAKSGAKYYHSFIRDLEMDGETNTGYKRVGAISLHTDESKLDKLEERAYQRRADAPEIGEITRLTAAETKQYFPVLSDEYASVHISGAARVNGKALQRALENGAIKYGAKVLTGNARLHREGNQVTGIMQNEEILLCDQVIVTAGAWANELLRPLGFRFLVTHQKAQIMHFQLPFTDTRNWPVVMPPSDQHILAFENGRIIAGATHENTDEFDNRITAGGIHEVLKKALAVAPGLANSRVLETRVGFRPFTPGFLPVIGAIPGYKGLLAANGLGASGLTAGPYLGAQLAKIALGTPVEIDPALYSISEALEYIDG